MTDTHAKQHSQEERNDHPQELKELNENATTEFLQSHQERISKVNETTFSTIKGNITTIQVDAIVNAANEVLEGGGGIDQAIHTAAGSELAEECKNIPKDKYGARCYTGDAKITGSHKIRTCLYVIHTVGPYLNENGETQPKLLASCYSRCLDLCDEHGITSIAFPCISTGYYGYPMVDAAKLAVKTTSEWIRVHNKTNVTSIIFVAFNDMEHQIYAKLGDQVLTRIVYENVLT